MPEKREFIICRYGPKDELVPVEGESYDDVTKARRRFTQAKIGDFEEGTYAIMGFYEKRVVVSPPPAPTKLAVSFEEPGKPPAKRGPRKPRQPATPPAADTPASE